MGQKHFAQRDHGPCLAGTGRHHQQRLTAVGLKGITDRLDRRFLIVASGNRPIHQNHIQTLARGTQIKPLFQIPFGPDRGARAFLILPVKDTGIKAVCEKDHGTAAIHLFQTVRVIFGFLPSAGGSAQVRFASITARGRPSSP